MPSTEFSGFRFQLNQCLLPVSGRPLVGNLLFVHAFRSRLRKEKTRMKSKLVFGLLATMLVLALAPSSFAQIQIQLFSAPSAQEVQTIKNAQTADPNSSGA